MNQTDKDTINQLIGMIGELKKARHEYVQHNPVLPIKLEHQKAKDNLMVLEQYLTEKAANAREPLKRLVAERDSLERELDQMQSLLKGIANNINKALAGRDKSHDEI